MQPGFVGSLAIAFSVAACGAAPVPDGYVFPTRSTGNSGAAALLTGTVIERNGCLYVQPAAGTEYLVIWPDSLRLVIDDMGLPTIMDGSDVVARVGDVVRVGGGESASKAGGAVTQRCPGKVWEGGEIVPG